MFAANCLTSCVRTATTVPSPIDAALPLTFATALTVPVLPLIEIVTSPLAALCPPASVVLALILTVLLPASADSIVTGPTNFMPIEPILTSISALTDCGLSADTTRAPGTFGTSLFRSLTMLHAVSALETGKDSFKVGILRSSVDPRMTAGFWDYPDARSVQPPPGQHRR